MSRQPGQRWCPGVWSSPSPTQLKVWHTVLSHPPSWSCHTHMNLSQETVPQVQHFFRLGYLHNGRPKALLAGPGVAQHSFFLHLLLIETLAAFLWANATQTYRDTENSAVNKQAAVSLLFSTLPSCIRHRDHTVVSVFPLGEIYLKCVFWPASVGGSRLLIGRCVMKNGEKGW